MCIMCIIPDVTRDSEILTSDVCDERCCIRFSSFIKEEGKTGRDIVALVVFRRRGRVNRESEIDARIVAGQRG